MLAGARRRGTPFPSRVKNLGSDLPWRSYKTAGRFYYFLSPTCQARGHARLRAAPGTPKLPSKARLGGPRGRYWGPWQTWRPLSPSPRPSPTSPVTFARAKRLPGLEGRGLARSRSPAQRVNFSHRTRGRRFPCRQVKRVMDKRAGTKTARHSFPPTVDADAGRRRAPERGAGSRAQAMLSPGCS